MAEGTRKNPLEYQREYNDFMYKLRRFLASKDMPMKKIPLFGGEEIDLYLLYKTVINLGGLLKVTDEKKWHEVAKCFNVPQSCLNSAFALRQLYVRYLEGYEKLYFLGEDGDESSVPRTNVHSFGNYPSLAASALRDPQKNFERLVLSLQSGLPNEVDFAINICMLLSNVNNSVFNLLKAPAVVDIMLAHVGVFVEDSYGTSELYKEWYRKSGKDFLKFWKKVLNCDEIKELLPKEQKEEEEEEEGEDEQDCDQYNADELFNLDKRAAHDDFELQRVLQVCTILHNFSFDKMDASVLSSHPVCLRFLLFCLHSNIGSLKKLATDTMTNLADKMVLEPLQSLNCQLFFFMVDRYIRGSDRHNRICAMNILKKICLLEANADLVCKALDISTYEALIKVLILEDVQLLLSSLETLYQVTGLGQVPCDNIVSVEKSIEIFVSIVNVCVETFSTEALSQVKVIDHYHGIATGGFTSTNTPGKIMVSSPEKVQRSDVECEAVAQRWLRASYDVDPVNTVLLRDVYADYLTTFGKLSRNGMLNSSSFHKILRSVFPDLQVAKLSTGNQQLYGLVGIRKKIAAEHLTLTQPTVSPAQRPTLCRTPTPPLHTTPSIARPVTPPSPMETNYVKLGHVQRAPTPPIQREVPMVTDRLTASTPPGLPMGTQSSSLPGQRDSAILTNTPPSLRGAQRGVSPSFIRTQTPNPPRFTTQANATSLFQAGNAKNSSGITPPFSGTTAIRPFDGTSNPGNAHLVSHGAQTVPSSAAVLTQRNVSTVGLTTSSGFISHAPTSSDLPTACNSAVISGVAGLPNTLIPVNSGAVSGASRSPLPAATSVVVSATNISKTFRSDVVAAPQAVQGIHKGGIVINGEERSPAKTNACVTSSNGARKPSTVTSSKVNGDSGVFYVAKEEQATKMTSKDHEVVIAVVENPSKQTAETRKDLPRAISPSVLVTNTSRKRGKQSSGDTSAETTKADSPLTVNGPFVASEMLRNVAKRQRCNSEGASPLLVNGVGSGSGDQKDPMAWDEVAGPDQKAVMTSPKMPFALNGIRVNLVAQHAGVAVSKVANGVNVVINPHSKTNTVLPGYIMPRSTPNAVSNHLPSQPIVTPNPGAVNPGPETVLSVAAVVVSHGQSTSSQAVVVSRDAVASTCTNADVMLVSRAPTGDTSWSSDTREEQAAGTRGSYRCMWNGCSCSFSNSKLLYNHAVSVHAPKDQLFTSCQWEGCSNVRRSRSSLLFHLRQRHLSPAQTTAAKDPSSGAKPQRTLPSGPAPVPQPGTPPVFGKSMYPPHPSVNPLLMSLKEQLLQTEQESPLTKSVRLTAALILRNIARFSPAGRRKLKRYESSFTEIMCSKVESNGAIAACLHEMTRKRQEAKTGPKR